MTNNKSDLKISFLPIVIIALIIFFLISIASFWNKVRTQNKFTRLKTHTEAIYEAHKDEFIAAAKSNDKNSAGVFINQVNIPEKGIYNVRILVKDDNGNYFVQNYRERIPVNPDVASKIKSILSEDKSVATSENIFLNMQLEENNLFSFTPIKENGEILGFVMLSVRKDQDL